MAAAAVAAATCAVCSRLTAFNIVHTVDLEGTQPTFQYPLVPGWGCAEDYAASRWWCCSSQL